MRVAHFASLGALAAAAGLATAQPPAPPPSPANPLAPPVPMNPMPTPPPPGVTPTQTPPPPNMAATPPAATQATPLPSPTPMAPVIPPAPTYMPAASTAPMMPAAAWASAQPWYPSGPFSELAHSYNAPMQGPRAWGSVEYLMWWVRPGPVPIPLVNTTVVPEDLSRSISAGGVADPLARTVFGNQKVEFGTGSGVRGTVGAWLDDCHENGLEVSMFFLPQQSRSQSFTGGTGTNAQPALTVPFNSVGPGAVVGETSAAIAGPFAGTAFVGTITDRMTTDLWGANVDGLFNLWKGEFWRFDGIGGFKFMDLDESLGFTTSVLTSPFGSTVDNFRTVNHFYGGEIGGRVSAQMEKLGFQLTGKVGIGDSVQSVTINGSSITPTNFGGVPASGGLFAQSSNIGTSHFGRLSIIPQVNASVSYDINCHLKVLAGYDFLYWSNVARPGEQIDRNINPNLAPVFGGSSVGTGTAQPARLNRETDFWAQGVSLGLGVTW